MHDHKSEVKSDTRAILEAGGFECLGGGVYKRREAGVNVRRIEVPKKKSIVQRFLGWIRG